ncbi:MAG: rRNA pseudouridine synthase [Cyanosarcina radialis HA8281-LM2]|jgi:23S rRNA pseudouridine2605 synthase|nr:rRNA pseudouridine synthase [Cyanosarcina radialis HA8281-LM2]
MTQRLQKILSQWGIASRRHAEQTILAGRVRVNGQVAQLGQTANPEIDRIEIDGKPIGPSDRPELIYLLVHKPIGVVSTCDDPQGRPTVLNLLPPEMRSGKGLHPVGRLDAESTGALLLTNDGELTFFLTHPRHQIAKTYEVWVKGHPTESILQQWRDGVMLSGRKTLPVPVKVLKQTKSQTMLEIVLKEGRNRQIRRVAAQLGHSVVELHRTAIGQICLDRPGKLLLPGQYRPLEGREIAFLQAMLKQAKRIPPLNAR